MGRESLRLAIRLSAYRQIMLHADSAGQVANNAFLKLCRLDVSQETEKWARTAPKFAADGRVAVVTVDSGFQSKLSPTIIRL